MKNWYASLKDATGAVVLIEILCRKEYHDAYSIFFFGKNVAYGTLID